MKKIFLLIASLLMLSPAWAAPEFKEGVNYDVIKQTATKEPEVLEFFSYYCPHCYKFEPLVASLTQGLPKETSFKRNPVAFLGREMGPEMQRAYASALLLNVEPQVSAAIFKQLHEERVNFADRNAIKAVFVANGVSEADFDAAVQGFTVSGMLAQYDRNTASYEIRGVPAFVINGKYQVKLESISSAEQFNDLVNYLLKQK